MKASKRIVALLLTLIMVLGTFSFGFSAMAASKKVTKIKLNKSSITIYTGQTYTLKATVSPSNASNKKVSWKSSKSSVAKVSSKGVVTAIKKGTATVTCYAKDGSGKKATCKVTVKKAVPVTKIKLSETKKTVYIGDKFKLSASVAPSNATNKSVKWYTGSSKLAIVNSKGTVKALKAGTVNVVCKAKDGSGVKAICKLTIKKRVAVSKITLSETKKTVYVGDKFKLTAKVSPSDATNSAVKWYAGAGGLAAVNSKGTVRADKAGTINIVCKAKDGSGVKAMCKLTILEPIKVTSVTLDRTSATLKAGESITLKATVLPEDATNPKISWLSSDKSVATVSDGVIKAVSDGKATITAEADDGSGKKAVFAVTVSTPLEGISLSETNLEIGKNKTKTLSVTYTPAGTGDTDVVWTSSNTGVATVSSKGVVTAKNDGTAVITCTSKNNGSIKAVCNVKVTVVPVSKITLSKSSLTVACDKTASLKATVTPDTATDTSVTWKSSDDTVAVYDKTNGLVRGIKAGTAIITCTANDGSGVKAECKVTVTESVKSVNIFSDTDEWYLGKRGTLTAVALPESAADRTIKWSSSEPTCVTVTQAGIVNVISVTKKVTSGGTTKTVTINKAVITAENKASGVKATYTVNITDKKTVKSISFVNKNESWYVGQTGTPAVTFNPTDASDKSVTFISGNPSVISVSADGVLTAKAAGRAKITVKSDDNKNATAEMTITVGKAEISASITGLTSGICYKDRQATVIAKTDSDSLFTEKGVKFVSENEKIATVMITSSSYKPSPVYGVVRFVAPGKTRIRAVTLDGSATSEWINITVRGLVVEKSFFDNMSVGSSAQINAYVSEGSKLAGEKVTYTAGTNAQYFEISESGLVKVIKKLPADGAFVTVMDSTGNLTERVYFSPVKTSLPSSSDSKAELLKKAKAYSAAAANGMSECYMNKYIAYSGTQVTDSSVKMSSSNLLIQALIIAASKDLDDSTADELIYDMFKGTDSQSGNITASKYPVLSLSESDIRSITVDDNGGKTFTMTIRLNDIGDKALADISSTPYAKAMPVLDKAYLDGYIGTIKNDVAASMDGEAKVKGISYGTVKQKYTGGYVILTIDKTINKVVETECHFKSDMTATKATLDMTVYMDIDGSGRKVDITMKTTASFKTSIEETITYKNIEYK